MRRNFVLASLFLLLMVGCEKKGGVVDLADYLETYSMGDDATLAFHRALDDCRERGASTLIIPEGTYNLYPDYAYERYQYVTNNDASLKRILLDLVEMEDFEIRGENAVLMLHGYMSPISITRCENITISGIHIDYDRTFHTEGKVMAVGDGYLDVYISEDFPHTFKDGKLRFCDALGNEYPSRHMLEFDAMRREPAFRAQDSWINGNVPMEDLGNDVYRVYTWATATPGNIMVFGADHRLCPAIVIDHSTGVLLHDLDIWHAGGMGVVGQFATDVELNKVRVVPSPGKNRVISVTADATHFVHGGGYLRLIDCEFFNQTDDASNIHGYYCPVKKVLSDDRLLVAFAHEQQEGQDVFELGSRVEFQPQNSLIPYAECTVTEITPLNCKYFVITLEGDLSQVKEGDLLCRERGPEVLIKGCRLGNNRARGFLLGSRLSTTIEDCWFHSSGASIFFEGDGLYWYEQAGPRNVVIRGNTFENCMYGGPWGSAPISSGGGPRSDRLECAYNRNILIENNHFILSDPRVLDVFSIDSCVFRNNKIEFSDVYPKDPAVQNRQMFITNDCSRTHIEQ